MKRQLACLFTITALLLAMSEALGAPRSEKSRAYKPAERREQEADGARASAVASDDSAPVTTYEQELQAAKEKRDQDLDNATTESADRRSLEKKKQQIFAQYAAIVAALKDKYEAAHPNEAGAARPAPGKAKGKPRTARAKPVDDAGRAGRSPRGKAGNQKARATSDSLAEAQEKLEVENSRHAARLEQLNDQLKQAESSDNPRDARRVQKLIEKENNSHDATRRVLERRVRDLGGAAQAPPSADQTAVSGKP